MADHCDLHAHLRDQEKPLTFEDHHVIPQAWQQFAMLPSPSVPLPPQINDAELPREWANRGALARHLAMLGAVAAPPALWDPRTVGVAPSCHRNVHHWIVELMHALAGNIVAGSPAVADDVARTISLYGKANGLRVTSRRVPTTFGVAGWALERYVVAGHDLVALMHVGLWGQA